MAQKWTNRSVKKKTELRNKSIIQENCYVIEMLLQISGEKADLSTGNVNIINFPDDIIDYYTSKLKPTVCQKNHKHGQKN